MKIKSALACLECQGTIYIIDQIQCYGVYIWVKQQEPYESLEMCERKSKNANKPRYCFLAYQIINFI